MGTLYTSKEMHVPFMTNIKHIVASVNMELDLMEIYR